MDEELKAAALAAYERGRWQWAAQVGLIVIPLVIISLWTATQPVFNLGAGCCLLALTVGLRWRGGDWAGATELGLGAGAFAYAVPFFVSTAASCCTPANACTMELAPCILGGVFAGLFIALGARRSTRTGLAAASVAGLLGMLTCAPFGMAITLGMAGAVVVTTSAVMSVARAA